MTEPERRLFETTVRLRDTQAVGAGAGPFRFLEGRAVPYETWTDVGGWFLEQFQAGAFERSTKGAGKGAPLLLFHDNRSWPIGHAERWSHDDGGMDGVWRLNGSPEAQRAAQAAEAGDLTGLSVGFGMIRYQYQDAEDWAPGLGPDHMDRLTHYESRLHEVSVTPTPAYADAGVTLVRTAAKRQHELAVDHWRHELQRLRSR
jgi:HK97 family phage prohead protease